ncbi:MAG: (Fe-S)-binding protein [Gammaproteobacteria bacterium]|nr:(Fe-S)-binding protein [Gammaproteobacteria bacterium]
MTTLAVAPPELRALLAAADQCVLCGLCSAQCPTYALYQTEAESPRGRITLIQALLKGQISPDDSTRASLGHCLSCRRCEAQCPSGVPYGRLIDGVKAWVPDATTHRAHRFTALLTRSAGLRGWIRGILGALPNALLPRWGKVIKRYARAPSSTTRAAAVAPVALFTGCITELADQAAIAAALHLLTALEVDVACPPSQVCCGAIALHAGQRDPWLHAAHTNARAFGPALTDVLSLTPGCTASLREYALVAQPEVQALAAKTRDVGAYLLAHPRWSQLQFHTLPKRVGVHVPCAQRNVLKDSHSTHALLKSIPGITLVMLPELPACCGAAGTQMLHQPQQAQALRTPLLEFMRTQTLDIVVSTNIGCALHLTEGLIAHKMNTQVMHPLTLLADLLISPRDPRV